MNTQRDEQADVCRACGVSIDEVNERYAFGEDAVICWSCGVERGGIYDGERDAWLNEPDVGDLSGDHAA